MERGIRKMKKPIYEILSNDIETVEDMIDALMIAPKEYKLHPMGNKCALAVDHIHECVYADDEMGINDYGYEIVSEANEMALPVETDVSDENLETYADKELYVVNSFINHIKELNCKDTRVNYKDCNGKFVGEWLLFAIWRNPCKIYFKKIIQMIDNVNQNGIL